MAPERPQASAAIVVAGIVAILAGVFGAIFIAFAFFATTRLSVSRPDVNFPTTLRPIIYGTWIFFLLCAIFLIAVGINVLRLRNWARTAILIIAGLALLFGLVGIGAMFLLLYLPQTDPSFSKPVLGSILACIYGVPVIIAVWWLVLFTRPSIAGQFLAGSSITSVLPGSASRSFLNNPQCPLAIRIIGWYLASFIFFVPFLPFVPSHLLPALYFGHLFVGPQALFAHFVSYSLMAVSGLGLLLLKRWGYALAILSQALVLLAGLVTALSSSLETQVRAAMTTVGLPEPFPIHTEGIVHNLRYFMLLGLLLPIAVIVLLFLFRRPFLAAADKANAT